MNDRDAAETVTALETAIDRLAKYQGRQQFYIPEVAKILGIPIQEDFALIERGELRAKSVVRGIDLTPEQIATGNPPRNCWRVPMDALTAHVGSPASETAPT